MSDKQKFDAGLAASVAGGIMAFLLPQCCRRLNGEPGTVEFTYCQVAGSLRRKKAQVGDVEILYVSQIGQAPKPGEMFPSDALLADVAIDGLLREGKLEKRPNVNGDFAWGSLNKLALHTATGLPVDLFRTTTDNFWVSLVIRTGPKEFNIALIQRAKERGLQLHAYGAFTDMSSGEPIYPKSEKEVFELAGMPWLEPEHR